MSKYIDKDELWERLRKRMVHHIVTNTLFNTIKAVIDGMPTIEVKGGDLEDAILLTKDAYSDLCLRASLVSEEMEFMVGQMAKDCFDKMSEDCISRSALRKEMEMYGAEITLIDVAPSVVPTTEQSSKVGEWLRKDGRVWSECSACGSGSSFETKFCGNCGANMRGAE